MTEPADPATRYAALLPPAERDAFTRALAQRPAPAIRLNPLKTDPVRFAAAHDWPLSPVPWCAEGFTVDAPPTVISQSTAHQRGLFYIQDSASMLPVSLFSPPPPDSLTLDMAAAPGGKTTHLVSLTGDASLVIAGDTSAARLPGLISNLKRWGSTHTVVMQARGEQYGAWWPNRFGRILLDAPCSGGELDQYTGGGERPVSPRERRQLHKRQLALLTSGLQALRPGGELVYATCTLAPEENEAVIDALLDRFAGNASVVAAQSLDLVSLSPGLPAFGDLTFHPSVALALRAWPHRCAAHGFFAAKLTKLRDTIGKTTQPPGKTLAARGFSPLDDLAPIDAALQAAGVADIAAWLHAHHLVPYVSGQRAVALPLAYLRVMPDLPVRYAGLPLGRWQRDTFTPAPELLWRALST